MTFDLEKAREANHDYLDLQYQLDSAEAEIERLRADNAGLSKAVIDIQEERDLAQAEFRAYHKAWEEGAARIKELEDALVEERAKQFDVDEPCPARTHHEYCDILKGSCDGFPHTWEKCPRKQKKPDAARQQLQAEGKIGPNAKQHDHTAEFFRPNESPAKSWQVTDGRVRAICWAEEMAGDCKAGDVLRAMLTEAER